MIQKLKEVISLTAAYYRQDLADEVLLMYAEDLSDIEPALVIQAYQAYRRDTKNTTMPLPAKIRAMIFPEDQAEGQAREIAARVQEAITRYGYSNGHLARAFIGEIGWGVVHAQGGWSYICENLGVSINMGVFQAQVRELAKDRVTRIEREQRLQISGGTKPTLKIITSTKGTGA